MVGSDWHQGKVHHRGGKIVDRCNAAAANFDEACRGLRRVGNDPAMGMRKQHLIVCNQGREKVSAPRRRGERQSKRRFFRRRTGRQ